MTWELKGRLRSKVKNPGLTTRMPGLTPVPTFTSDSSLGA